MVLMRMIMAWPGLKVQMVRSDRIWVSFDMDLWDINDFDLSTG